MPPITCRAILPILCLLLTAPCLAQWQEIGNEQIPDILKVEQIRAVDEDGVYLADDSNQLGVFVEDGGYVGVGTAAPAHQVDIRTLTGRGVDANSQNDTLAIWGHGNRADRVVFFTERYNAAGNPNEWTNVHHRFQRIVDSVQMGFIGFGRATGQIYALQFGYGDNIYLALRDDGVLVFGNDSEIQLSVDTSDNRFRFGTSSDADKLTIDTDDGSLASDGNLDCAGSGEFGDPSNPATFYQPACAFQSAEDLVYDHLSDSVHPSSTGTEAILSVPCPWLIPGTRIKEATFVVLLDTGSDRVNFSVRRQSTSSPGATQDIVAFGGADYTQSSGMTHITGDYYRRTETCDHTVAGGEKVWSLVELYCADSEEGCRLVGVEWAFEKRKY